MKTRTVRKVFEKRKYEEAYFCYNIEWDKRKKRKTRNKQNNNKEKKKIKKNNGEEE